MIKTLKENLKTTRMKNIIIYLASVLIAMPGFAQKSEYVNNLSLEDRVTYHRAMETVVYGIPMINMISIIMD